MRTRFELVLEGGRSATSLRAAGEEALEEIARVEADLSAFRRDSILAEVNAEAARRPVTVDGAFFAWLERAGELAKTTGGAFDPTVGALLGPLRSGAKLSAKEQAALQRHVGFARRVRLDASASTVTFAGAGVRLDPGAMGKGYALDRAAAVLRGAGVKKALLHGGTSSVYALGAPAGAKAWTVALQHPVDPEGQLGRVRLRDRALGVSAIHGRIFRRGAERVGHVLDPRTGASVDHTLMSAVTCASCADADAISTALLVVGRAGLHKLAQAFPEAGLMVVERGKGDSVAVETVGADFLLR